MKHAPQLLEADLQKLSEVKSYIENNLSADLRIVTLSKTFGIGKSTLRKHFQSHYRHSIYNFILQCRMAKAMTLITNHATSIRQIGLQTGYKDASSFTRAFSRFYKNPPVYFFRNGEL